MSTISLTDTATPVNIGEPDTASPLAWTAPAPTDGGGAWSTFAGNTDMDFSRVAHHDANGSAALRAEVETTAYAGCAAGISIDPPCEDGSKRPMTEEVDGQQTWKHLQSRRAAPAEIAAWYARGLHGVGCVCGEVSGGAPGFSLNVLDFDIGDAYEAFRRRAIESGLAELLERVEAGYLEESPKGGKHLPVRVPGHYTSAKLARRPDPADPRKSLVLVETKCEGGFIILAPSHGPVHPSGRPYVRLRGELATIASISAEEWRSLCDVAASLDEMPREPEADLHSGHSGHYGNSSHDPSVAQERAGPTPGDAFAARTTWDEILIPHGWTPVFRRGETTYWRRPDKAFGISASTNHGGSDCFYCFSTSTPFAIERSYTKFGAYALLEHKGDFHAAAKALAARGFGEPKSHRRTPTNSTNLTNSPESGGAQPGSDSGEFVKFVEFVGGVSAEDSPPVVAREWPSPPADSVFFGLAGQVVRAIEPHTEADTVALLVQLLVLFGNLVGRSAYFEAEATRHHLNLFATLVGLSSKGRKGTSFDHVRRLAQSLDEGWARGRIMSGLSSGEGLIWAVRDPITKREAIKEKGRVVDYQDVIDDPGVDDKRLVVVETEFANALKVMTREGNTLSVRVREAWDSGQMNSMTKNCPAKATDAHISVIGHITRDELERSLTATDAANGFANRFLWLCVRRSKLLPFGGRVHTVDFAPALARLTACVEFARGVGELRRNEDADRIWGRCYAELSEGKPGLLGAVIARAEAQVMRLACLYALLDRSALISGDHLDSALALWDYADRSARYIFGDALGDPDADTLMAAIRSSPMGLSRTQISADVFQRNKPSSDIARILGRLLEHGLVRREKEDRGAKRPVEVWYATTPGERPEADAT